MQKHAYKETMLQCSLVVGSILRFILKKKKKKKASLAKKKQDHNMTESSASIQPYSG